MNNYKTIKECAIDIICKEGDVLRNKEIAEKVNKIMGSKTTANCISWYKNKINRGLIKVNVEECKWFKKDERKRISEITTVDVEEQIIENEAEKYVYEYEKIRTGKYPNKMMSNKGPGYDFDSGDRHVEVKGSKKKGKTWLQLTSNETNALIKDPKFHLYLVEGDFDKSLNEIDLYIINKNDLLEMAQMKIHARLTQLSNKERRKSWKI